MGGKKQAPHFQIHASVGTWQSQCCSVKSHGDCRAALAITIWGMFHCHYEDPERSGDKVHDMQEKAVNMSSNAYVISP